VALAVLVKLQLALGGIVNVKPDPSSGPGTPSLEKLVNWIASLVLLALAVAILIGAAQWALGSRGNNYSQVSDGKSKVLYGLLGAFLVGAGSQLINFFYHAGTAVK
jgi:hypothetical protein